MTSQEISRRVEEIRENTRKASDRVSRWDRAKLTAVQSSMSMKTLASKYEPGEDFAQQVQPTR
jgi:hypothetical protein